MKKLLILFAAFLLSAGVHAQDTSKNKTTTGKSTKMKDCIMMKDGKLMMKKNGTTTEMTQDMTLNNGTVVMKDGTVKTKDGKTMTLKEGQRIYMDGTIKTKTSEKAKPQQ
ncbi:MAG TPA: DUF6799 domain-containing protein [Chitinophagaceae bacterium]|nr:DUF6799 domain-containing protein [Chitinophagaceae bacterium]